MLLAKKSSSPFGNDRGFEWSSFSKQGLNSPGSLCEGPSCKLLQAKEFIQIVGPDVARWDCRTWAMQYFSEGDLHGRLAIARHLGIYPFTSRVLKSANSHEPVRERSPKHSPESSRLQREADPWLQRLPGSRLPPGHPRV